MTDSKLYVTAYGSHRHADWACANGRRAIASGDVLPATEKHGELPLCAFCNSQEALVSAPVKAKETPEYCSGSGKSYVNPKRLYSRCPDCDKTLKVRPGGVAKHKADPKL